MKIEVCAQVVGSLSDLAVDDGDLVEQDQMICSLESMKVMFPIYAPAAGRVTFLRELGEIVGEGEPVAEIETD